METATRAPTTSTRDRYIPRGRNQLHTIFERHLDEFCDVYDERYAATYGMFRLDRIREIGRRFLTCGDYRLGVARIRIDNSVRLTDVKSQESLAAYIARPPRMHARAVSEANDQRLSLKKIRQEPFKGKVLFHTKYSDYFKENVHLFVAYEGLLVPDALRLCPCARGLGGHHTLVKLPLRRQRASRL